MRNIFLVFLCIFSIVILGFKEKVIEKKEVMAGKVYKYEPKDILNADKKIKVLIIEFGCMKVAKTSPVSKKMQIVLLQVEKEYKGDLKIVIYETSNTKEGELSRKYKVKMLPTQIFFNKEGEEFYRCEGFISKENIIKILKEKGKIGEEK